MIAAEGSIGIYPLLIVLAAFTVIWRTGVWISRRRADVRIRRNMRLSHQAFLAGESRRHVTVLDRRDSA